ncbi:MAG TPA: zinc ribbon domain-containing protein [Candidatus Limnocylindrales bacterium]|nr:zinc ribbon domain-containing protein [Candidatus Limnocylindrales bacterium]
MPLYEYKCRKCGHVFEKIENHSASTTKKCPKCGAKAERQLAAPAIQFKGSGWYVTDYAGKNAPPAERKEAGGDGAAPKAEEQSGESKPAPEKSAAKKKK